MLNLLKKLRQDEYGVILSAELVVIGSVLVVGLITGLTCLQTSVNGELKDLAGALGSLDQSYAFSAHRKPGYNGQCCAYTAGSSFRNCETQPVDCPQDVVGSQNILVAPATACCSEGGHAACGGCRSGCQSGGCGGEGCAGEGCGGCGSCSNGPRCINTGVPNMKATEWRHPAHAEDHVSSETLIPSAEPVILEDGTILHEAQCLPVPVDCPVRNNDLNIPDYVW